MGFCPINKKNKRNFSSFHDLTLPVARRKKIQKIQNIMEVKFLKEFLPHGYPQHPGQTRIQSSANTGNTFPVTCNQNIATE